MLYMKFCTNLKFSGECVPDDQKQIRNTTQDPATFSTVRELKRLNKVNIQLRTKSSFCLGQLNLAITFE